MQGIYEISCLIHRKDDYLSFVQYMWDENPRVARNAVWVLTHSTQEEIGWLQQRREELATLLLQTSDTSLRRMVLNLLERMTYSQEDVRVDLLDFCLEHMLSPEEPSGVQCLCMKLADKLCAHYPELIEEFRCTLENMELEYYSPGLRTVRRNLMKKKRI